MQRRLQQAARRRDGVLVARGRVVGFDAGQVIYCRSEPGKLVMMVVTGRVRIGDSVAGGKESSSAVDASDIFGELAAFDGLPRSVDASANVPSEVLVLGRRSCCPSSTYPAARAHRHADVERTRRLAAMLEDAMFLNTDQRVAKALFRLAEETAPRGRAG